MKLRQATLLDLDIITSILKESQLPPEGCRDHTDHFIVAEIAGQITAVGGMEQYGDCGLLRSVAVRKDFRNKGLGKTVIQHIIKQAADNGVETLYLLTENARSYFTALGFTDIPRNKAPSAIKQTQQFSALCPDSATLMWLATASA